MRPLRAIPALSTTATPTPRNNNPSTPRSPPPTSVQRTMWDFIRPQLAAPPLPTKTTTTTPLPILTTLDTQTQRTPSSTPVDATPDNNPDSNTHTQQPTLAPPTHPSVTHNRPWGDIWDAHHPQKHFRVLSKNTGTINPTHMDMTAIINTLETMGASVFAAQETNINWNPDTTNTIYMQGKQQARHLFLSTSTSSEPAEPKDNWYKPGGTLLLAFDKWTSRIAT